jgi:hypothetical protein
LYDEANKKYLMGYSVETKPRTSMVFILHQADLMAARIEFEREWLPKFKEESTKTSNFKLDASKRATPSAAKQKALGSLKSEGLKSILDNL